MTDSPSPPESGPESGKAQYRVLARKYRPTTFSGLVGQETLVRTLTNAIQSGRIAQAYVLTGVRGVGKTSTARIIARALNCVGPDGTGGPTIDPCGVCEHCRAIAEDRHVDVLELDAASRTGVADMRELIEGVRYRPTSARYKIYIIDEVHMLSTQAFNALLKTLEEPPEHVKFVFATTEIRKVPVTVLSRCQRFDLRRVDEAELAAHFASIAEREGARVEPGALRLIARAADGSVRDGLSLLDQAISHTSYSGGERDAAAVSESQVREMLGLADRTRIFDLFDAVMTGDMRTALDLLRTQYESGADPGVVIQDLLELTHWLTRIKVAPDAALDPTVAQAERVRGRSISERLSMAVLTRTWQMLLKGLGETRTAPDALQAAEMALIRIAYAADMPTPAEAIEALKGGGPPPSPSPPSPSPPPPPPSSPPPGGGIAVGAPASFPVPAPDMSPELRSFDDVIALFRERKEMILSTNLTNDVRVVSFETGRIEFNPGPNAPPDLANRLSRLLSEWTGRRWWVSVTDAPGEPSLGERKRAAEARRKEDVASHPLVRAVLEAFPGAVIGEVRERDPDGEDIVAGAINEEDNP
ncbi:MAG: DNA polymerase III subunit gamma/tau [Alphaproteobacteria bacterium]|nr:DNA polymerase III subunit gamma/tau [Alphaproteobacteria bacterium]